MTKFTGRIEINEEIKYQAVEGWYKIIKEPSGTKSWSGEIEILSGEIPDLISGLLIMDNGKSGNIIITQIPFGSDRVSFQGSGQIQ